MSLSYLSSGMSVLVAEVIALTSTTSYLVSQVAKQGSAIFALQQILAPPTSKQTLVYMAGVDYQKTISDYAVRGGITAVGPQVYGFDKTGNVYLTDTNFHASSATTLAHSLGIQMIPLVAGINNSSSDEAIISIITNANALQGFISSLETLCLSNAFDGIQLDWETSNVSTSYQPAMTSALQKVASALSSMSPPRSLSLTTYLWNYMNGPYNTWTLSQTDMQWINLQDYTGNASSFISELSSMIGGMKNKDKLSVGLGDYSGASPPIAGTCMQQIIQNGIQSVSVWPAWGTELSSDGWGYKDTIYSTTNYYALLQYFLNH